MAKVNDDAPTWTLEVDASNELFLLLNGVKVSLGAKNLAFRYLESFLEDAAYTHTPRIAGRTLKEWDACWERAGPLTDDHSSYSKSVGLYRLTFQERLVYLGRAIEHKNGGINKRLRDYTRDSDSARKSGAGPKIHENRFSIDVEVLVTGNDKAAAQVAAQMETLFIEKFGPPWNKVGNT